ncbi:MAG: alpha-ketoglutarate-dependent dioxygenase AlkB [Pseudohongiellaceae bacterium]
MQANLFTNQQDPTSHEDHDLGDGWVREFPVAFSARESETLRNTLIRQIPWRQDRLRIAGRELDVPRLQCWMGDADYAYSGIRLKAEPWHPVVDNIRQRVESLTKYRFNVVLLNYYRHGQDSVAWHADDEPELGDKPVIASLTLGAERPFQFRHKRDKSQPRHRFILGDGSLLLMGESIQNNWMHQLPKVKGLQEPRLNLTFRLIAPR